MNLISGELIHLHLKEYNMKRKNLDLAQCINEISCRTFELTEMQNVL